MKTRTFPLLALMVSYTLASLALPVLAKVLTSWRYMKMIAVFPNLLVIGAYFMGWIPESLSWFIGRNRIAEAKSALIAVARINGKNLKVRLYYADERISDAPWIIILV